MRGHVADKQKLCELVEERGEPGCERDIEGERVLSSLLLSNSVSKVMSIHEDRRVFGSLQDGKNALITKLFFDTAVARAQCVFRLCATSTTSLIFP